MVRTCAFYSARVQILSMPPTGGLVICHRLVATTGYQYMRLLTIARMADSVDREVVQPSVHVVIGPGVDLMFDHLGLTRLGDTHRESDLCRDVPHRLDVPPEF